jgi:hypothetical protein
MKNKQFKVSERIVKNQQKNYKTLLILKQSSWETYQEELSKEFCKTQKIRPYEKRRKKKRITVKYLSLHIPEALGPELSDAKESSTLFKRMLCTTSNNGGKKIK